MDVSHLRPRCSYCYFLVNYRNLVMSCIRETRHFDFLGSSEEPPLWSSGQSSWLQIQRSRFDSRRYQIFWVVGQERGPLSLVNTIEKLFGWNNSGTGLEIIEYGGREPSRSPRDTPYPQNSALTSPTSGGRLVGIVRSRTKASEFCLGSSEG
jgi:hypothetical protein